MANVLIDIEKGVEVVAEDLFGWIKKANSAVQSGGPGAITALGVLAGAVETALTDAASGASNPAQLILTLPTDIADFKAVWPDVKAFLLTLGIKL